MKKKRSLRRSSDWLFGMSGRTTFIVSAVLIFAVCFVDSFHGGKQWIPTYVQHVMVNCLLSALLALGLNFISGYLGQTSLGHAVFYGIGAYTTAVLLRDGGLNFWITILAGMLLSMLVAIPLAAASLRVKGAFLVVITYAFCEIFRYVAINTPFLGGTAGIAGIKAPEIFGVRITKIASTSKGGFMIVVFLIVAAVAFFSWRIEHSRVGFAFAAIREDEIAAKAMGINVQYYKVLAMVISAAICSIAGSIQAAFATMVSPELFSATKSIQIFSMVVVGGRMSIKGMILGGTVMTIFPEIFRSVKDLLKLSFDPWNILYGLLLVVMMRVRPQGLWGKKDTELDEDEAAESEGQGGPEHAA